MRVPVIEGVIRRRILVNFRVDPHAISQLLPSPFRPKLRAGHAVAGICLIRLERIRPRGFPEFVGMESENAAHRIAVLWDDADGRPQEGVFVTRRDTNSLLNQWLGGRLFPGEHHRATFDVNEGGTGIALAVRSHDGAIAIDVTGQPSEALPRSSIFPSLAESSAFFEAGAMGYSATSDPHRLERLMLRTTAWRVTPLAVARVHSSYFADESVFPRASIAFDHALLMTNVAHEWHAGADMHV